MNRESLAPVVVFCYKRLDVLKKTIDALSRNFLASQSDLIIYSDGPKNSEDALQVELVREYLNEISGFNSVVIFFSPVNKGLASSIIQGVSEVLQSHSKVIVLEDDLISSKNFLLFMNACLDFYRDNERINNICGYSFKLEIENYNYDNYFLNRPWPWGWATWRDRWEKIDWNVVDYSEFQTNKSLRRQFKRLGSDVNAMLDKQMRGALDSWAIRWTYHQFKCNGIAVFPSVSKVSNFGFDRHATHTKGSNKRYITDLDVSEGQSFHLCDEIYISMKHQKKFLFKMSIISRLKSRLETFFLNLPSV